MLEENSGTIGYSTAAFFLSSIFKSELIPGTLYILPQQRSWSIRLVKGFAFSSHPRWTPEPKKNKLRQV